MDAVKELDSLIEMMRDLMEMPGNPGYRKIDRQYCIDEGYTYTDEMCLTVARSGSAGFVSF